MAQTLQSPGVSISVIDQSFYTPAAPGTTPLIFVATAQDKQNASKTGVAQGTTKANAGTVYVITSQRDLVDTFGTPYFETDASNNPVNGSEISEYGLQAAYSVLGISSQAYVVRADVDLNGLKGTPTIPTGTPAAGTVWLDTSNTTFGINVWSTSSNNGVGGFTLVTPDIIDDTNYSTEFSTGVPLSSYGAVGDFAMVVPSEMDPNIPADFNTSGLFYKSATLGWTPVKNGFDSGKSLQISPHYNYPVYDTNTASGSVWICTTPITNGAVWDVKYYNGSTETWNAVNAPIYSGHDSAIAGLDSLGGGMDIPTGTIFVNSDYNHNSTANFELFIRNATAPTTISVTSGTIYNSASSLQIRETTIAGTWNAPVVVNVVPSTTIPLGQQIASAINTNSNFMNVSATWNSSNNSLSISHMLGGEIELKDLTNNPLSRIGFNTDAIGTIANLYAAPTGDGYTLRASNWLPLTYSSQPTSPGIQPADGTLWFNNYIGHADIMYNNGTAWVGYRNAFPNTDVNGPILSASAPTTQSSGIPNSLVTGDIWVDTSSVDVYGQTVYVYNSLVGSGASGWVLQDVMDHTSPTGWVFHDARWGSDGTVNMDTLTPISTLLTSNYLDPDAPSPLLYPKGTRLWNTRRSSNNVKQYIANYINVLATNAEYQNQSMTNYYPDRWVTASPNDNNGVGQFGRLSQRAVVVKALQALVTTSTAARDTDTLVYNLIATPGYTELIPDMVNFNVDISQYALVVGDTPFRLEANATTLANYGKNAALATKDGDTALVSHDNYLAVYYPSGYTNDNYGNNIVVPPSHMLLNTIINNDNIAYPWFAPAGTRRGGIINASSVGYVDSATGQFVPTSLHQALRDVLAGVQINPIATLPGQGLTVMGQYTRDSQATALNRINVARLVAYIRRQLDVLSKPYLFEPNDTQTRNEIKATIEGLMVELVGQRALYDYVVVCDTSNNTPTRIDQNELWVDIAIEPVKAVEFIYIPLRLLNTGAIASGNYGSQATGSGTSSSGQ